MFTGWICTRWVAALFLNHSEKKGTRFRECLLNFVSRGLALAAHCPESEQPQAQQRKAGRLWNRGESGVLEQGISKVAVGAGDTLLVNSDCEARKSSLEVRP